MKLKKLLSSIVVSFLCVFGLVSLNSCGIEPETAFEYTKQVNLEEYKTLTALTFVKTESSRSLRTPLEDGVRSRSYRISIGQTLADLNGDGEAAEFAECAMKVEESYIPTDSAKSILTSSEIYVKAPKSEESSVYGFTKFTFDTLSISEVSMTETGFYDVYDSLKKEAFSHIVLPETADNILASGSSSNVADIELSYILDSNPKVNYTLSINKWNKSTILEGKYKVGRLIEDNMNTQIKTTYTFEYPEYFASLTSYTVHNAEVDLKKYQDMIESNKPSEDPSETPSESANPSETPSEQPKPSEEIKPSEDSTPDTSVDPTPEPEVVAITQETSATTYKATVVNNGTDFEGELMIRFKSDSHNKELTFTNMKVNGQDATITERIAEEKFLGYDIVVSLKAGETLTFTADVVSTKPGKYRVQALTANNNSSTGYIEILPAENPEVA